MKSLESIRNDNHMTSRDFGGMCQWFIFREGDLLGCFVNRSDALEYCNNYEYDHNCSLLMVECLYARSDA